jgi:RNA polymerase sigma-54 factor
MRMGYGINLEQTQKLIMTPELLQAITVLQLSATDLVQYLDNAMLENPLLDVPEEPETEPVESSEEAPPAPVKTETDYSSEWCEYLSDSGGVFDHTWSEQDSDERYNYDHFVTQAPSLPDYLVMQLHLATSDPVERKTGEFLIGNINDTGYLQITLEEVQQAIQVPLEKVEKVLSLIQNFDPPGVAARDLSECLLIQLEQRGLRKPVIDRLVCNYLNDLAQGKVLKIAETLSLTPQEVQLIADLIKTLDPKPGRNYSHSGDTRYINPDVVVEKIDGKYLVLVNDISVPRLIINKTYQTLLKQRENCDSATTTFIENKLKSAVWLIRSIEQRRLTLYRVVQCIVDYQEEFLEKGISYLKTLTLKQIAQCAEFHESTVSRAIANKYIQTPQGVYELKFFFSSGVENILDGEMVAAKSIKHMVKELVDGEDPCKPLSDQRICEFLKARGISIARRTVAKYRQETGILPVRQRKRYK